MNLIKGSIQGCCCLEWELSSEEKEIHIRALIKQTFLENFIINHKTLISDGKCSTFFSSVRDFFAVPMKNAAVEIVKNFPLFQAAKKEVNYDKLCLLK